MNLPFLPLQQSLGSQSCVPTCVRAMLLWHGQETSPEQISEWCQENADGCNVFLAMQSLGELGFDVAQVQDEDELLAMFALEDPEPVIIMVRPAFMALSSDHALVIYAIEQQESTQIIHYMDPLDGASHEDATGLLLNLWNINGSRAFIVRPE